jgi:hypothetical protein
MNVAAVQGLPTAAPGGFQGPHKARLLTTPPVLAAARLREVC